MRNCVALFLVLTLCVGCKLYDPHDYVVHATYSERYKDIAAYKRAISHLSKHEKMLVELYVDQEDLDEVQDGKTGKAATITQIIKIEQPVYEKQVADAKVIADNNDNMRKLISLTLTKKQSLI